MRLIDADALKAKILEERDAIPKTLVERYGFGAEVPNRHGSAMRGGIRVALRCMEQTPTIDAEPVKHGRWEHTDDDWFDVWRCTACGEEWVFGYDPTEVETKINYCPVCGAKMDLEGDDVEAD